MEDGGLMMMMTTEEMEMKEDDMMLEAGERRGNHCGNVLTGTCLFIFFLCSF